MNTELFKRPPVKGRKFRKIIDEKTELIEIFCSWNTTGKPLKRAKDIEKIDSTAEE